MPVCKCCDNGEQHKIYSCDKYSKMPFEECKETASHLDACYNNLNNGHLILDCRSNMACRMCAALWKHHSLLCPDLPDAPKKVLTVYSPEVEDSSWGSGSNRSSPARSENTSTEKVEAGDSANVSCVDMDISSIHPQRIERKSG